MLMEITQNEFAALLNPRPAVLVTCCDAAGTPNVLTMIWLTPLSHDPPLVGISIGLTRMSHALVEDTGEFVINVVGQSFVDAIRICGNHSGSECDKIALAQLQLAPARCVRPPVIQGALARLECRVVNSIPAGDHTLFVGRVVYAAARDGCFAKEWHPARGDVLVCMQRDHFGRFVDAAPVPPAETA